MEKSILCFGDSNTYGYSPEGTGRYPRQERWTGILAERLGPEYRIIDEGLCGRTTVWEDPIEGDKCGIRHLPSCIASHTPLDLVIIMLGTNDLKAAFHANAKYIAAGIKEYIRLIKNPYLWEEFRVPDILIAAPAELRECIVEKEGPGGNFDRYSLEQSRLLAAALEKICREYGTYFLNASDYADASEIDGIHLDAENHRRLAEGFAERIRELHTCRQQDQR